MFQKIKDKLKNNKALMISLVAVLIILIGGVSYAVYDYSFIGNDSKLESGSVSIKFLESNTNVIDLKNALPISDSEGKKGNSFNFAVTSEVSYDTGMKYTLNLKKLSVDAGYTSLNDNQVKIYLTDYSDSSLLEPTLISGLDSNKIYSKTNKHSSANTKITDKYKLRVWVDSNVDASSWDQGTKLEYKFKIDVDSNEVKVVKTGVETLVSKVGTDGLEKITHEANSDLQIGASEAITEYRYRGSNPNNYVSFGDGTWRIIGVFPTEGEDGTIKDRIKLVRSESIGNSYWDSKDGITTISYNDSDNNSFSSLVNDNDVSSGDYKKLAPQLEECSICENSSSDWSSSALRKYLDGVYRKLIISSYDMIDSVKYYLGGISSNYEILKNIYDYERSTSSSKYYSNNSKYYVGKFGLMYVSDYYYANDGCSDSEYSNRCDGGWLKPSANEWFLTHNYSYNSIVSYRGGIASIASCVCPNSDKLGVRPVVYLNPNVVISSGNGTSDSPYEFSIS